MKNFEQVSSDGHQMSLEGIEAGGHMFDTPEAGQGMGVPCTESFQCIIARNGHDLVFLPPPPCE